MKKRIIRFGKHKGKTYQDVPSDYLQWLCDLPNNGRRKPFPERTWARQELKRREAELLQ